MVGRVVGGGFEFDGVNVGGFGMWCAFVVGK